VTAMPVLWRNPSENIDSSLTARKLLFNVILLHLSEESRDILKNQGLNKLINEVMNKYQRPLFDYLSFWKYLDLYFLEIVISSKFDGKLNLPIIRNEILKLFINENTNLMHLLIPQYFDYQLHLIPGAEYCLSRLDSLHCHADIDQSIMEGFARICKLIKKLSLVNVNYCTNNSGIIKLIEEQKKLNDVSFDDDGVEHGSFYVRKSFEESLIKHSDSVQYLRISWIPVTRILSCLVNLISLNIAQIESNMACWSNIENVTFPLLKILKVHQFPSDILVNLIKNTKGGLSEICICYDGIDSESLFRVIGQSCPNLIYLEISLYDNINSFIPVFESLLINCQFLSGFIIDMEDNYFGEFNWCELFIVLAKSSPINLFKFKFYSKWGFKLEDMELFLKSWEGKNPLLLEMSFCVVRDEDKFEDLLKYFMEKGMIEYYSIGGGRINENFEWI
jgi:hypothetical protein